MSERETHSEPPVSRLEVNRAFLEEHVPWMLTLTRRVLSDDHLAEDAVQEALLAAHANSSSFEGRSAVRTWLYRVTLNAALRLQRKRDPEPCDIDQLQASFDANACRIEEPWGTLPVVEDVVEQAELRAFVQQCVGRLPENYRVCLQLRDLEELTVKEVSQVLEISEQNVKVRTHRARAALKHLLEPMLRGRPVQQAVPAPEPKPSLARAVKGVMMAYMPMMITCEQFEDFIIDYLEGDLPEKKRKLFEFHIRTCRECREYLAAYERARDVAIESSRRVSTLEEVPSDLLEAVTRTLSDQ